MFPCLLRSSRVLYHLCSVRDTSPCHVWRQTGLAAHHPAAPETSGCVSGAHSSLVQITQTIKTDCSPQTQNSASWPRFTDPSRWKSPVPLLSRHKHTSHTTNIINTEWKPDCAAARLTPEPDHSCCHLSLVSPAFETSAGPKARHHCTSTGV